MCGVQKSCAGVVVLLAVFLFPSLTEQACAQLRQLTSNRALEAVTNLAPVGRLSESSRLHLAIGLSLRNQEALTNLLKEIYNPQSPQYHQYLTVEQFTERFGPAEKDYQALIQFAQRSGLTVRNYYRNRLLLDVDGSVGDIERVFHVVLHTYQHPKESRTFFAPDTAPSVPVEIPVLAMSGLDDFVIPRPADLHATSREGVQPFGTGSNLGAFTGPDLRAAYAPEVTLNGAGQSVGIVSFDGYYTNDVETYVSMYGGSNVIITNVLLDGFDGTPGGHNLETALDIEMAIAMAPGLNSVIVYEGTQSDSILGRMAADNIAKQLSSSWSYTLSPIVIQAFQEFEAQGQVMFQASGDSGAWTGLIPEPIEMPDVVTVGGTSLTTDGGGGPWSSDAVWHWGGGGSSPAITLPTWQQGIDMTSNQGSTSHRNIPDVALVSTSVFAVGNNGSQYGLAGTSVSAPLWAGFAALVNQQEEINGNPPVGFLNPLLYAIGKGSNYTACFHDVTDGNNTNSSSPTKFFAVPGYDLCTGWGTPNGSNLINALAPFHALRISPASGLAASGQAGGLFAPQTQIFSLTNVGGESLNWTVANTPVWLNVSPASGTLGTGTAAVTVGPNAVAQFLPAGNYTADLLFGDSGNSVTQDRQFTLTVNALTLNGGFETGNFASWAVGGSGNQSAAVSSSDFPQAVHSGSWGAKLINNGLPLGTLSQSIATVPNRTYLLSLWLDSSSNPNSPHKTTPNQFSVSWNGTTLFNQTNLSTIGWTNLQFVVRGTAPSTLLQFNFRDDFWALGLDDIVLQPVPPPLFRSVARTNGSLNMAWAGVPGLHFQLQWQTNLSGSNWNNSGGILVGTNLLMMVSDPVGSESQRFYRIVCFP